MFLGESLVEFAVKFDACKPGYLKLVGEVMLLLSLLTIALQGSHFGFSYNDCFEDVLAEFQLKSLDARTLSGMFLGKPYSEERHFKPELKILKDADQYHQKSRWLQTYLTDSCVHSQAGDSLTGLRIKG